jgi:hypothetical protein
LRDQATRNPLYFKVWNDERPQYERWFVFRAGVVVNPFIFCQVYVVVSLIAGVTKPCFTV